MNTLATPKNYLIDTHVHLYDKQYKGNIEEVIERALAVGVRKMYMPNTELDTIESMLAIAKQYPHHCHPMLGLHPCDVRKEYEKILDTMEKWLDTHPFVGIGEVGMDLYWDKTYKNEQIKALHRQIDWALAYDLPLVLHARNSLSQVMAIIQERQNEHLRGVFHCFSGNPEEARRIVDMGFVLGIGGVITFANSKKLPAVVATIDLSHMVLETDGPYLAPVPHRGKRNEPSFLPLIAEKIANIKHMAVAEVVNATTKTATLLFRD